MEWWQTLLMTAGSCFVTLLITFVFNWITNRPKVKREQEKKERAQRKADDEEFREELRKMVQSVHDESNKQSEDCQKDHQCLAKLVAQIKETNIAQNKGLQAVLKDLLKIRYLEWIHKGYAPMDARDDLERMYTAYHNLGANGVLTALRNEFLELPVERKEE